MFPIFLDVFVFDLQKSQVTIRKLSSKMRKKIIEKVIDIPGVSNLSEHVYANGTLSDYIYT